MSEIYSPRPTKWIYVWLIFILATGMWGISYAEPGTFITTIFIILMGLLMLITIYMWWQAKERYVFWVRTYGILSGDVWTVLLLMSSWLLFGEPFWLGITYVILIVGIFAWVHVIPEKILYQIYQSKLSRYYWVPLFLSYFLIVPNHRVFDFLGTQEVNFRIALGFIPAALLIQFLCHCLRMYMKYPEWTLPNRKTQK